MGKLVLVLGHSGSGKSTSLRNFNEGEVGILNVASKPLPFRKPLGTIDTDKYGDIIQALQRNTLKAYVIDDANYLMAFENFDRARDRGYDKFVEMAQHFHQLLKVAIATDKDTIVYFFMHPEYDIDGRLKPKTIGKMLDEKLNVEGLFTIVLLAERTEQGFVFVTENTGNSPVKAPMGMFQGGEIDNDLKAVDTVIREYYGLEAIGKGGKEC